MATMLSKARKTAKKPPATKLCVHCHCVRSLSEFYSNRDWLDQAGKDVWCKNCVSRIQTKDDMRKYFYENNRKWDEKIWEAAKKKAELQASRKDIYQKSSEDRREVLLEALTCNMVPTVMQIHYSYIDNSQDINAITYEDAKETGKIVEMGEVKKPNPNVKTYNAFFNGDFKPAELEYLLDYYNQLDHDFDLSDVALRDNAKKLAKAALTADKVQNDFMSGRCSMKDVTDAMTQYNSLLSIGNFAASKRKPGDKGGTSSFSEISLYLETHGFLADDNLVVWPQDDVDKTISEFKYFVEAIDLN